MTPSNKPYTAGLGAFLWHHIKPYKWRYFFLMLPYLFVSLEGAIYSYIGKRFVDIMALQAGHVRWYHIKKLILILACSEGMVHFLFRCADHVRKSVDPAIQADALRTIFSHVQGYEYTFFEKTSTGMIASKIKGIFEKINRLNQDIRQLFMARLLRIVISIGYLFWINRVFGVIVFVWCSIFSIAMLYVYLSKELAQKNKNQENSKHFLMENVSDSFLNIQTVLTFENQRYEADRLYQLANQRFIKSARTAILHTQWNNLLGSVLYIIGTIGMVGYMVYLFLEERCSPGDFTSLFTLQYMILSTLWHVVWSLTRFVREIHVFQADLSLLLQPYKIKKTNKTVTAADFKQKPLVLERVSFQYEGRPPLIKELSLEIKPGRKIGLVGDSGVGKSTLIKLLMGYYTPSGGDIRLGNIPFKSIKGSSLRNQIGFISQENLLFNRTIAENIGYGRPGAHQKEIEQAARYAQIHAAIMQLPQGYDTYVGEAGGMLSGGQRQRVSIARAILKDAPLYILDEPTAALDRQTELSIQENLRQFLGKDNKTLIVVAHGFNILKEVDEIIVLHNGQIFEKGSHQELLERPGGYYKTRWESQ